MYGWKTGRLEDAITGAGAYITSPGGKASAEIWNTTGVNSKAARKVPRARSSPGCRNRLSAPFRSVFEG